MVSLRLEVPNADYGAAPPDFCESTELVVGLVPALDEIRGFAPKLLLGGNHGSPFEVPRQLGKAQGTWRCTKMSSAHHRVASMRNKPSNHLGRRFALTSHLVVNTQPSINCVDKGATDPEIISEESSQWAPAEVIPCSLWSIWEGHRGRSPKHATKTRGSNMST